MPGNGPHRLEFVGKTPWVFTVLVALLFVNTFAGLIGIPVYEHFAHRTISYGDRLFLESQFVLLALIGLVFLIYRKSVRYTYRCREQSK
jgi:hypothetical protein